jgi:hypothetical protein
MTPGVGSKNSVSDCFSRILHLMVNRYPVANQDFTAIPSPVDMDTPDKTTGDSTTPDEFLIQLERVIVVVFRKNLQTTRRKNNPTTIYTEEQQYRSPMD